MVLRAPAPRMVDDDIAKAARSSLAFVLLLCGIVDVGVGVALGLYLAKTHGGMLPLIGLFFVLTGVPTFAWGLRVRGRAARLLSDGTLRKGRVMTVTPLSMKVNDRTFSRVEVEVRLPGGEPATMADGMEDTIAAYFRAAMDQQQDVDVLCSDDIPRTMILPAKIVAARRGS